jgi:hypothetical protein
MDKVLTIEEAAQEFSRRIEQCLKTAVTEEDLRIESEKTLEPLLVSIGLDPKPRYERLGEKAKAVYGGLRPDAVHGRVVIEYEPPRSLGRKAALEHARDQVWRYLVAEASGLNRDPRAALPYMAGIGFDGERVFFVRFNRRVKGAQEITATEFHFDGPHPFDDEASRTFLTQLRSLSRFPLTAEELERAFGPGPDRAIAPHAVSSFVEALTQAKSPRVRVFFDEWKRLFGIVYGEQFTNYQGGEVAELARTYGVSETTDFQELLFCVHTYFALLMKLIAAELLTLRETAYASSFSSRLIHTTPAQLASELDYIEEGSVFAQRGITNFIEGDFFRWYAEALTEKSASAIREIARTLSSFEPATTAVDPASTRDLLKNLYQYLVPQPVRHRLGEYYTPDWLAELLMDRAGYDGSSDAKFLDPACGSGTFLVLAIQRIRRRSAGSGERWPTAAARVLKNVWGFDLNPLAVIASRTNYLFALGDQLGRLGEFEIPVYLADSVLWPGLPGQTRLDAAPGETPVKTSVQTFHVPSWWLRDGGSRMRAASLTIERLVKGRKYPSSEILSALSREGLVQKGDEGVVEAFCVELLDLERDQKNGIWARFLKNTFAPLLAGRFDYVIGNPPWIRWGYLSKEYRAATEPLWSEYGLFSLKGYAARLGGGEKDFSMLFTYACADNYLRSGGTLAFLLTRETLKSTGAGEGFRRFLIGKSDPRLKPTPLKVTEAADLTTIQPFEGASNKTSFLVLRKGLPTKYPIPYVVWTRKKGVGHVPTDLTLAEARLLLTETHLEARPLGKPTGPWQTLAHGKRPLAKLRGINPYRFIIGARCEPYGIYWVEIKEVLPDGSAIIRNLHDAGKRDYPAIEERLEPDLLFPVVRGRDVRRWGTKTHIYAIVPQDPKLKAGYDEKIMRSRWPRTYHYLSRFETELRRRAAFRKYHAEQGRPFYSQYNISEDSFQPYRVVIKRMATDLQACVVSTASTPVGVKPLLSLDTTTLVPLDNKMEAHYVCGMLNSAPVREHLHSFASAGRGFATPSILRLIGMPRYDRTVESHGTIAKASIRLHALPDSETSEEVGALEASINLAARSILRS